MEIGGLKDGDDLALWAHRRLPAKTHSMRTMRLVEGAYQSHVGSAEEPALATTTLAEPTE